LSARSLVVGAGVNELVAAHLLAHAGLEVLVLDERGAVAEDFFEGAWVPPAIVRRLGLERHGLEISLPDPWLSVALPDGEQLDLSRDVARSAEAIRRLSPRDAARWPEFCARMHRLAGFLEKLYCAPPPEPLSLKLAVRARLLGREGLHDLLRILPMPVADLLDDWFECNALKGALGTAGVLHLAQGPRSGGTAFRLLHHHVGSPPGVFRPPQSNLAQILERRPGLEIRHGARVERIRVRQGRAEGVVLAGGEEIAARLVVSGADPRRTLLELVEPGWLDPELARALRHVRSRGVVARIALTLDRAAQLQRLALAPSLEYLERAHDDAKYGRVSGAPYLEAVRQEGSARNRVLVHFQYAPYALADGGWDEARRAALGDAATRWLAPYLSASVLQREVLSPRELEGQFGYPEGQAHHAELALDQALWMRPVPALAHYRTPIAGLYLCGPGTHPGGGVAGACGMNAARAVLRDLAERKDA
jgi:phytoene dehydrogenase-like protein